MDQDIWNRDNGHLAQGVKMVAAAVVSALFTATLVIAVGQSLFHRDASAAQSTPEAVLVRTGG